MLRLRPFYAFLILAFAFPFGLVAQGIPILPESDLGTSKTGGKRFALVIGINEYKDLKLTNLKNAKNDAEGILRTLYRSGSYDKVKSIVQSPLTETEGRATKYEIENEFSNLIDQMSPEDFLLVYFSGHGFIDYEEKAFLLPEDGNLSNSVQTGISVENLILKTRLKKLKRVIFVIDACRNPEQNTTEQGVNYLNNQNFNGVESVSVLYSTKSGYASYEDAQSAYGVFTKYVIYGLEGRADSNFNGKVSYSELSEYVISSLKEWSKSNQRVQKPYVKYYGESSEDIVLTYAFNPETSMVDAPLFNPYNPTYAFRSLVFPGWGHYERGQKIKGIIFMSLFSVALLNTAYRFNENEVANSEYSNAVGLPPGARFQETIVFNYFALTPARERAEEARKEYDLSLNLLLALWLGNVFDFYVFGPERPKQLGSRLFLDAKFLNHGTLGRETLTLFGLETSF